MSDDGHKCLIPERKTNTMGGAGLKLIEGKTCVFGVFPPVFAICKFFDKKWTPPKAISSPSVGPPHPNYGTMHFRYFATISFLTILNNVSVNLVFPGSCKQRNCSDGLVVNRCDGSASHCKSHPWLQNVYFYIAITKEMFLYTARLGTSSAS